MQVTGIRFGYVISVYDNSGSDMIAVRLTPDDNDKSDEELELNAFPLIPKMLHIKPKVGEGVLILFTTWGDGYSQRYYIGPVISQPHRMYYDSWLFGGDAYQRGGFKAMDVNPYSDKDANGVYPDNDDVSIIGRKNCDIQIKDDDIRIRAGVKLVSDDSCYKIIFNRKNPAFMKLKYHETPLAEGVGSTATIVADKINLLGNNSTEVTIEDSTTAMNEDLISDEKLKKVLEDAYKLPYGEKLVELLQEMINVFCKHTHNFIGLPPKAQFIDTIKEAAREPLDQGKLLSNTVRIN